MSAPSHDRMMKIKAHSDWAVSIAVLSVFAILFYLVLEAYPNPLGTWLREDGLFQNAQAVILLIAAIGFVVAARRSHLLKDGNDFWRYWAISAWVILMVVFVGEEISWGQRIFGWETPETGYFATNVQGETNFHNQPTISRIKARLVNRFLLIVGVALPLAALLPPVKWAIRFFAFPVVPLHYSTFFIATYLVHAYIIYPYAEYGYAPREYSETLFAIGLAMFALHGAFRPDSLFRANRPSVT